MLVLFLDFVVVIEKMIIIKPSLINKAKNHWFKNLIIKCKFYLFSESYIINKKNIVYDDYEENDI